MELTIYQIDAFANRVFEGNPAAVCPLESWLPDDVMQSIASENNLSETAFYVPNGNGYHIRWFSPLHEVDLCGHATLASAHVLFEIFGHPDREVHFESRSGLLRVTKKEGWLEMDFPAQPPARCVVPALIAQAFEATPLDCLGAEDYILVFDNEDQVLSAAPDMTMLGKLDLRGVAITARGRQHDFVSRFFAPKFGINEDPVTGSSFTQLAPFWSGILGKTAMNARQISKRGGEVRCRLSGDRVIISGKAVLYMKGKIWI